MTDMERRLRPRPWEGRTFTTSAENASPMTVETLEKIVRVMNTSRVFPLVEERP